MDNQKDKHSLQFLDEVKEFLRKRENMKEELLQGLIMNKQKDSSIEFRKLFFNMSEKIDLLSSGEIQKDLTNCKVLEKLNNGMKYTFIFDYTGSSQEFKAFDILERGNNLNGKGSTKEEIEIFVCFPENNQKYEKVIKKMTWSNRSYVRITDDSSMAVCLNYASLFPDWQLHFQISLLDWLDGKYFSPGRPIGLGGNISVSLNQIEQKWERSNSQSVVWIFQDSLKQRSSSLFKDGSGNGALIRSAGLFQMYIKAYEQFLKANLLQTDIKSKFDKVITEIFMLDQHDQSSMTHSGMQAQLSMLLLAFIQIKLLIKQLSFPNLPNRILANEIKDLVKEFEEEYLEQTLTKYAGFEVKLLELKDQIRSLVDKKKDSKTWEKYLNVNTNFGNLSYQKQAFRSLILLYYQLFYRDDRDQYLWEDAYFIQYLANKRDYQREGINLDITNPAANTNTSYFSKAQSEPIYMSHDEYDEYLNRGYSGYFTAYAPDCMSLILHLIVSSRKDQNLSMIEYLYRIALCKGDCDSYGAVMGTVLASFDLDYHTKYKSLDNKYQNDPLFHLNRMNLNLNNFLSYLNYQVEAVEKQLLRYDFSNDQQENKDQKENQKCDECFSQMEEEAPSGTNQKVQINSDLQTPNQNDLKAIDDANERQVVQKEECQKQSFYLAHCTV